MQKGVFWVCFFVFWWFCLFSLCFCAFVLKRCPRSQLSCNFWGFLWFCSPQKACLWNPCFLPIPVFFLFSFCLPFLCFLSINPFWKTCLFLVSFVFPPFLPFPFLMFACLFGTNFPKLLSFLAVYFSSVVLFLFSWCMFLPFCFYAGLVFGNILVIFMFLPCFLFCFQSMKKTLFSLPFWFFELSCLKGSLLFVCFMFLFLLFCGLCCLFAV